jgi:hypothetical protein
MAVDRLGEKMPTGTQIAASDQNGPAPASTAASPGSATAAAPAQNAIPFVRASRKATVQDFQQPLTLLTAGQQQVGPFDIQSNGFLRGLELYCTATTAGNAAATAFKGDAPFTALTNNSLQDPSSEFLINPYDGYELYIAEKYFAYHGSPPFCDARTSPNYLATTGAGSTGGSFAFELWVPLEDRERDAFCAVPNSAANKNYRYQGFINQSSNIYSTAPTTLPSMAVVCTNFYWTEPPPSIGNVPTVTTPNGNGSVAFLDREVFTAVTAQTNPTLILKNVGRVFKNILFVLRTAAGVRDSADWPNPTQIWLNNFPLYYKPTHTWLAEMADRYGFTTATLDVGGGGDTGVFALYDLFSQPGSVENWGSADQFLATLPTTKVQIVGSWGGSASSLTCLERTIKPSSGTALYGAR